MFDEDLTSLYPSIIMSLNIGRETIVGKIVPDTLPENLEEYGPYGGKPDRNNYLGLNDLKEMEPHESLIVMDPNRKGNPRATVPVGQLINMIEKNNYALAANGTFFRTDKESVLSTILSKWFDERKMYKDEMKKSYKAGDTEKGEYYHLMQYTMKILLNSLYGATALNSFRYGMPLSILSEAITLSGWRIIQESALVANRHMNKVIKNQIKLEI
jgi:DNA polymerase elongation subunit (family B)